MAMLGVKMKVLLENVLISNGQILLVEVKYGMAI